MTLIKTSLLNGIAVVVKMLAMLGINKVLAIYVGPTGYAALGQFQNAVQIITQFASGAINTGVIKYTAEYHDDEQKQQQIWQTAGSVALIGSVVTGAIVIIFSEPLATWFLHDKAFSGVFVWFAVTLTLFVFNTLLLAVLNGKKEISRYVLANIVGSVFALAVTTAMVVKYGLYGALVALAVYQSLAFFVTIALCIKTRWFKLRYLIGPIHKQTLLNLGKFTAMALISAACVPISQILIRNHLGETLGWDAAGYWEAMCRISSAYLMLITTTLSVYYLPRLAELKDIRDITKELFLGYKVIIPAVVAFGIVIFILRDTVIHVLFTDAFIPMRELFAWQVGGDILKVASWILAYLMLAKAMTIIFIITEILSSASFVFLSYFLVHFYGLIGVTVAYAINYAIYLSVLLFGFNYLIRRHGFD